MREDDVTTTIYADFNNADEEGYVRLNADGTARDLTQQGIVLEPGLSLLLADGDMTAQSTVIAPGKEGVWRASIVWSELSDDTA